MIALLLVLFWVTALLLSLFGKPTRGLVDSEPRALAGDSVRDAALIEAGWTALDDRQLARLLEDTPPC